MKSYLLLFFSAMLLLFALPKSDASLQRLPGMGQGVLKQTCSSGRTAGHSCPRKCLAPHAKGEQQAENILTDCGQQLHAVIEHPKAGLYFAAANLKAGVLPVIKKHLSPDLKTDPDPPRRG